jgi:hypothetical protein
MLLCCPLFLGVVSARARHGPTLLFSLQHTTTIYLHNQIAEYAKELTDRMPGNLKVAYFVNSGRCGVPERAAWLLGKSGGTGVQACV